MMNELRIVYMGTSEFSARILEFLLESKVNIVGVVSQPDSFVGRKKVLEFTPVKKVCIKYGIEVFQPEKIKLDYQRIKDLNPDLILTCAYGQIVSQDVLDIPKYKCINIHGSILPKYRGAAPIQYAILNNEKETGITYMEMIKEMDAGNIYAIYKTDISHFDTSEDVFNKLFECVKSSVIDVIGKICSNELKGIKQEEDKVSYSKMIKREDELINWSDTNLNIHNKVRAFYPFYSTYTYLDSSQIKVIKGEDVFDNVNCEVGKIYKANKEGIFVKTGDGEYRIDILQVSGKKVISSRDFVNGNKDLVGKVFYDG